MSRETIEMTLTNREIATISASIGTCMLIHLERHIPPHAALSRAVRGIEEAIAKAAALAGGALEEELLNFGTLAYMSGIKQLAASVNGRTA